MSLCDLSLEELRIKLDAKELISLELTKYYLERIKAIDPRVESFITVCEEEALEAAKKQIKSLQVEKVPC